MSADKRLTTLPVHRLWVAWHRLMTLCCDYLSGMLQSRPLLTALPPSSAALLSRVQGSDSFLLFSLLHYSLSTPRDGNIWGLTGSCSMLHSLEAQRKRCKEQSQPGLALCLFRAAELHLSAGHPRYMPPGKRAIFAQREAPLD